MNHLIIVGKNCSKIHTLVYNKLINININNYVVKSFPCIQQGDSKSFNKDLENFETYIKDFNYYNKIILPFYCEDDLSRDRIIKKTKIDFCLKIENICSKYQGCSILHNSKIGKILNNKMQTNLLYSQNNISCPEIITDKNYNGLIFSNALKSSGQQTQILENGSLIQPERYNTKFIDTSFEFQGEEYYASPRIMCVKGKINDICLRFRNKKENNPNVRLENFYSPELHNFYYEKYILPNLNDLSEICNKIGKVLGLGFYVHDFLFCPKTKKFFVSETGFKVDNIGARKLKYPKLINQVHHEKDAKEYIQTIFDIFKHEIENYFL